MQSSCRAKIRSRCLRRHLDCDPRQPCDLPFPGGAIGYFSYDLARRFERLPALAADDDRNARDGGRNLRLGRHRRSSRTPQLARRAGTGPETDWKWDRLVARFSTAAGERARGCRFASPRRCIQSAARGRTPRHSAACTTTSMPVTAIRSISRSVLRHRLWAIHGSRIRRCASSIRRLFGVSEHTSWHGDVGLLRSASQLARGHVETRPIRARGRAPVIRARRRACRGIAFERERDRAEECDDRGPAAQTICRRTANRVRSGCRSCSRSRASPPCITSSARVTGRLPPGAGCARFAARLLSGGSITAPPKLRAMQIIEELEPHREACIAARSAIWVTTATWISTSRSGRWFIQGRDPLLGRRRHRCRLAARDEYQETFDKAAANAAAAAADRSEPGRRVNPSRAAR